MTRDRLDRLCRATRAFRDAARRDHIAAEAARGARSERDSAARTLAEELKEADIPEGLGFEAGGVVVWWEESGRGRADLLGHVFLAFYKGQG